MDEKEAVDAQRQAQQDLTSRPAQAATPTDAIHTYLAGLAYLETRPHRATTRTETRRGVLDPS